MTPQELRTSVLQLAIQGKLVTQHSDDTPVPVDASFCGDTSDFFEIPEKWKWLSIKDVASVNTGLSFKKQDQRDSSTGSLRVLRGGNIGDDYKYHLYEDDIYVDLKQFQTKYIQLLQDDIITPSVTSIEKICKTGFIDRDFPAVTAGGFVYIIRCLDKSVVHPKYLLYFISSFFNKEQCKPNIHKSGQAFYNLKKSGFVEQPICVPPFAEQKRIVAKIEGLLPLIDRYEKAWAKLEDFNKRFPVDMQKSILQMAIQGKLVDQRPEEGTGEELYQQIQAEKQRLIKAGTIKKEKPLPEIAEDEIPFDIPESWKWCRLSTLGITQTGNTPSKAHPEYTGTDVPFITPGDILDGQIRYDNQALSLLGKKVARVCCAGTIMQVCIGGSIGKAAITDREVTFNQQINVVSPIACSSEFLFAVMQSAYFTTTLKERAGGTATPIINRGLWDSLLVPLPPLAEQKRIVAKLEEILPLCDRLK